MGVKSNKNKAYVVWKSMMQRCYKEHFHTHHPTYVDCHVCDGWHEFFTFEIWFNNNYIDKYFLDKDILVKGNKIYGPDTCCFVPREINSMFTTKTKSLHEGVRIRKNNRFQARIYFSKKERILGTFGSLKEAIETYNKEKQKCIKILAEKYKNMINIKVYNAMLNYNL